MFNPIELGKMRLQNRFVCSATYEGMAREDGGVTKDIIKRYRNLARGKVGLIISGYMYVQSTGRAFKYQTGIHTDKRVPGLAKLAATVHENGGKMVFQLAHAGRQTTKAVIDRNPLGPSAYGRDPANMVKPTPMTEDQIGEVVDAFKAGARRAIEAGADGIQLHAAHGYLINQFLSPYFNRRKDRWGDSAANRFRFLRVIVTAVQEVLPPDKLLLVKLNTHDHTPQEGITFSLAVQYAQWLEELGITALELSCGTAVYSFMNMCRGEVPMEALIAGLAWWKKPVGKRLLSSMKGQFDLEEAYNLEAARRIKAAAPSLPIILVGGMRTLSTMQEIVDQGLADLVSMSRPLIRDPFLIKKIEEGKRERASCVSCNKCLAAAANDLPTRCYYKGT